MKFSMEENEDIRPHCAPPICQELSIMEEGQLGHTTSPVNMIADPTIVKKNLQHTTEDMGTIYILDHTSIHVFARKSIHVLSVNGKYIPSRSR